MVYTPEGRVFMAANPENHDSLTLQELRQKLREFADERDWEQYHTPRNLLLAMVSCIIRHFVSTAILTAFSLGGRGWRTQRAVSMER